MNARKTGIVLGVAAAFFSLAMVTQQVIRVSQKPAHSGVSAGRSQAYQELQDREDYRVYQNSAAAERKLSDPYEAAPEGDGGVAPVSGEVNKAGS